MKTRDGGYSDINTEEGKKSTGKEREDGREQEEMPLAGRLEEYVKEDRISFHVPGHKGISRFRPSDAALSFFPPAMLRADITEIDGFDDLHHPEGIIMEAQRLAASLFGAKETFFLANGTTSGVAAAVAFAAHEGEVILVCRSCHESVTRGLILGGARPVYIEESFDMQLGIPAGVSVQAVREALDGNPRARALVITHPSYYGTAGNLREITRLCHSRGVMVIADEAHGAQLYFSGQPGIPGALESGCDIVIQSTHKMLGSLTQSSMLHVSGDLTDCGRLRDLISLMNSTSPSYLLMASLDAVRRETALFGKEIWHGVRAMTEEAAEKIDRIEGIRCVRSYRSADGSIEPVEGTRLLISARDLGVGGRALSAALARAYGIDLEFADDLYAVAVAGSGSRSRDFEVLEKALADFSEKARKEPLFSGEKEAGKKKLESVCGRLKAYAALRREAELSPREAFFSPSEEVRLEEASGRTAVRPVSVYPPGIPLLYPGEVITEDICRYLDSVLREGCHTHGISHRDGGFYLSVAAERMDIALFGMRF